MITKKRIDVSITVTEKELIKFLGLDDDYKIDHVEWYEASRDVYITGHQKLARPKKK